MTTEEKNEVIAGIERKRKGGLDFVETQYYTRGISQYKDNERYR